MLSQEILLLPAPSGAVVTHVGEEEKKAKHPGGRPRKIDEAITQKLEEFFHIDATVEEACHQAGINVKTYYAERERNSEFAERMDRSQEVPFLIMKKVVVKAANSGDGKLAMKWLQNRQRERYHEKVEQEVRQTTVEEVLDEVEAQTEYPEQFGVPGGEKRAAG
jgi:hypothetical protein